MSDEFVEWIRGEIRRAESRDRLYELKCEVESRLEEEGSDELYDLYILLIQRTRRPECGPLSPMEKTRGLV